MSDEKTISWLNESEQASQKEVETHCLECKKELDTNDEYHMTYGTCDPYCHASLVGL